ncbi:MAG TPA: ABC transporter substrate-binding protein [Vicinamibacterales bacterium]|nr:ABC transporter substrate-binding protein [Vicinamibacterales bacterium]
MRTRRPAGRQKPAASSQRRTWLGIFAAIFVSTAACSHDRPNGNIIILGTTNSATNLDPRVGTDEASQKIHQLIFNTLVHIDSQLRVVPELAESIDHPDPLTYIARLRKGVLFHNGRELTSADVVYTFRSFLDPTFKGRSGAYRVVAAVNAIDPYTVEFKLKNPLNSFPVNLVMGIVQEGSGAANARQPIGTGPYSLTEFVPDDHVALSAFAQHFAGRPRNDGIVLKVIPDDTMRGLELRKGTVDLIVNDLSPDIVWQLQREGRVKVETAAGTDYAYVGLNLKDPVLSHVEVRKAIGYAIDREAIVKYLRRGFATTAVGIVPPMSWAFEKNVFDFTHDPGRAEQLLDAAGFRDPDGPGPLPRFRLSLKTSTTEVYRIQAAAIQHDLARVGVAVDVRSSEFQTLSADVLRGNFQMYTLQFVGVTDPDILRLVYHSQQIPPTGLNRVRYQNADVDRLIEGAAAAADDDERRKLYGQAQQRIADDAPYIPLWDKTNVAIFQPDIHGVTLSPIADFTFLKDVYRQANGSNFGS